MNTPLARLLLRVLPAALVPWALGLFYALMLFLVIVLWGQDVEQARVYLDID